MAPPTATAEAQVTSNPPATKAPIKGQTTSPTTSAVNTLPSPLTISSESAIFSYPHHDSTPVIGTEFASNLQLSSLLSSPDLIRDLAVLISQRGVVFFRAQKLTIPEQQKLGRALGELTGKPSTSDLHTHPLTPPTSAKGDQISVISSAIRTNDDNLTRQAKSPYDRYERIKLASAGWHSDITFESVPSDYALLKINTHPPTGGDTVWASGYEVYDRLSPAFRALLEPLEAVHNADRFNRVAAARGVPLRSSERGAPENVGEDLTAVHPVIRTNPVTGWRTVFANDGFTRRILGVGKDESDVLLEYLRRLVADNHDLQVRFHWGRYEDEGIGDVAIWDNRVTYHTATDDYQETGGERSGDRVVSLGEKPYGGVGIGVGRREALGLRGSGGQQF